jgi:hypothetical protein
MPSSGGVIYLSLYGTQPAANCQSIRYDLYSDYLNTESEGQAMESFTFAMNGAHMNSQGGPIDVRGFVKYVTADKKVYFRRGAWEQLPTM